MVTKEFLLKNLSLPEEKVNEIYEKLMSNDDKSTTMRFKSFSEDKFLARLTQLKKILGLPEEEILLNFRWFAYAIEQDNEKTIFEKKLEFLKKYCDIGPKEITIFPDFLTTSLTKLQNKYDLLVRYFGFTKKSFSRWPNLLRDNKVNSNETVEQCINFYSEIGITAKQISKHPYLLTYDFISSPKKNPYGIKSKIEFYKENLDFGKKEFHTTPVIFGFDCNSSPEENPNGVQAKVEFLRNYLDFSNEDIKKFPRILTFDFTSKEEKDTSILSKINFFRENLGFDNNDFKKCPTIFSYNITEKNSPTSILSKIKKLHEIGLTNEDIKNNPRLLNAPSKDLKEKYMLWSLAFPDRDFLSMPGWFNTSTALIFARINYLSEHEPEKLTKSILNSGETHFPSAKQGIFSKNLLEMYPINEDAIAKIYDEYKNENLQPPLQRD